MTKHLKPRWRLQNKKIVSAIIPSVGIGLIIILLVPLLRVGLLRLINNDEPARDYSLDAINSSNGTIGEESCYDLGYRYGMCGTKSFLDLPCKPENDFVMPERCRGREATQRGINAGTKTVYDPLNLDKRGSASHPPSTAAQNTLNMSATPLEVLSEKLKDKTKSEVKSLVGEPDRTEEDVLTGSKYEYWIYGKTYTTKDRAIVFLEGRVLTVTFY